jgi:hypothetical protein
MVGQRQSASVALANRTRLPGEPTLDDWLSRALTQPWP